MLKLSLRLETTRLPIINDFGFWLARADMSPKNKESDPIRAAPC